VSPSACREASGGGAKHREHHEEIDDLTPEMRRGSGREAIGSLVAEMANAGEHHRDDIGVLH
jgi:hypothetical protein